MSDFPNSLTQLPNDRQDGEVIYAAIINDLSDAINKLERFLRQTPAPANLRATAGDRQVALSWDAVAGASGYVVEQATASVGPWAQIASGSAASAIASGLTNGTTYWFRVHGTFGTAGSSAGPSSSAVSATPSAPVVAPGPPTLTPLTSGNQSLQTTLNGVSNATSYQVFISTTTSFGATPETTFPVTAGGQASGYSVTLTTIGGAALTNGTTYYVMARAANPAGASTNSTPTQSGVPSATLTTFGSVVTGIGYRHWWRHNETAGTSLADSSSSGPLNATISGTYTLNQSPLLSDGAAGNKAVQYTAAMATTASSADFTRNGNLPYSYWITYRRTGANDGQYHAMAQWAGGQAIFYDDTTLYFERASPGFDTLCTTSPPAVGTTEHVLFRYDGSTMSIIRNGSQVASISSTFSNSNSDRALTIGSGLATSTPFIGLIDEFVFWDSYVSDAQALELYQAASGTTQPGGGGGGTPTDLHEILTSPPAEVSAGTLATVRSAILATPSGSTYVMPDGIYRLASNAPIHIPAGVTISNANKRAWVFLSRNWVTGGEAANTWSVSGSYWVSSRAVPTITPNEPGGVSYTDQALALRYEMCVGITAAGVVTRFASIAANSTPAAGQFCLDGTRHIRLGTNPANFARIEVVEADSATGRWIWPDGNGVTMNGIVFRYAASGPSADPMGSHDTSNFAITNCVVGDAHGCAVNCGGSTNVTVTDTLIEYAGGTGMTTYNVNGLNTSRCHILNCGNQGYDPLWQAGGTKFTVTTNHTCNDNIVANCHGSGLWWDESCYGPINVHGNLVHHVYGPALHFEISDGPIYIGTTRGNCFAYCTLSGFPTAYVSSSNGPGEIANNLIIANVGRGLQVYWATERSNDHPVTNWYWHNNHYIIEFDSATNSDAIYINDVAAAGANNNRGSNESYYFTGTNRWWDGSSEHTSITTWNATAFDEGGVVVAAGTATTWRAAWGV